LLVDAGLGGFNLPQLPQSMEVRLFSA
jgi:hypothetical protein